MLGSFGILNSAEGIENDDKILIIIGKNGGEPDVKIAHNIQDGLSKSGFTNTHIRTDNTVSEPEKNTSTLITIGGPGINQVTREFNEKIKLQFYEIPLPPTSHPEQIRNWGIGNIETRVDNYGSDTSNNFGLGFIYNLYDNETSQHIFVMAGIEAEGTQAASEYFFGQKCYDKISDVEFVVINNEVGQDENGCAEVIDFDPWESSQKIFVENPNSTEKNNLKITKTIKSNGVDKATFFPNEPFEYEIMLKNTGSESLNYSFDELLPSFLLLSDISSSDWQHNNSKIQCSGLINGKETITIKYEGMVSHVPPLGNWILDRTTTKYSLPNNTELYYAQGGDTVLRIQDTIIESYDFELNPESVLTGETFDAKIVLTNNGIQPFFANGTLFVTSPLEFVNYENKSSVYFEFGPINPEEAAEKIFKLQVKKNHFLWMPETYTVGGTLLTMNTVYDGTDWKLFSHNAETTFQQDILVVPQNDIFEIILIVSVSGIVILVAFLILRNYKRKTTNEQEDDDDDDDIILKDIRPYDSSKED
jgi:hypothetical protein